MDVAKLPKWAQNHIARLEAELAGLREHIELHRRRVALADGADRSAVEVRHPRLATSFLLPDSTVRLSPGDPDRAWVEASLVRIGGADVVEVGWSDTLSVVVPYGNAVRLTLGR